MKTWQWITCGVVLAFAVVFGISQCTQSPEPPESGPPEAYLDWRWIGIKAEGEEVCPRPEGRFAPDWSVAGLFDSQTDPQLSNQKPGALSAFCLYERRRVYGNEEKALRDLVLKGKLLSVERDCMAVAPAGDVAEAAWERLRDHFHFQVGRTSLCSETPPNVRLALLDTEPTREHAPDKPPPSGNSKHGYTLANLANDLVCGDPSECNCVAQLTTQLALPFVESYSDDPQQSQRDDENGGYVGTIFNLAEAISAEVAAWDKAGGDKRLILNLSLGWDPVLFGGLEERVEDMPLRVQAVYRAIEYAVSRGALVVAAAGNVRGGPGGECGPLLPGGWERRPATENGDQHLGQYRPLVYAAGGVRSDCSPLGNARPCAIPRLVAYSDHAVTDCKPSPGHTATLTGSSVPTATLTGSSVATVVVSATAAAVWHHALTLRYMPLNAVSDQESHAVSDQESHAVMAQLYSNSVSIGQPADFYLNDRTARPAPDIHRVFLCRALEPHHEMPESCIEEPCAQSLPSVSGDDLMSIFPAPTVLATDIDWWRANPETCNANIRYYDNGHSPASLCPFQELPGLSSRPWGGPQPEEDPCPNCTLLPDNGIAGNGRWRLLIEITEGFNGELTDPTLVIGRNSYSIPLPEGSSPLKAGSKVEVRDIDFQLGDQVFLELAVNGEWSTLSSVLVAQ